MLTTKNKELSLLAQKIAAFKGCVVCGRKPTLYQVEMKGFCAKHKAEAESLRKKNYLKFAALDDAEAARTRDCIRITEKKSRASGHKVGY